MVANSRITRERTWDMRACEALTSAIIDVFGYFKIFNLCMKDNLGMKNKRKTRN